VREGREFGIHNSSWLESPDADIRDIRGLFGHESVAATEIYTHISAARQRRTVQLLET
jgi:site-specific recombinase XerD